MKPDSSWLTIFSRESQQRLRDFKLA
jgi:hypothetical protein